MISDIKVCLAVLPRPLRWAWAVLALALAVTAAAESAGALAVYALVRSGVDAPAGLGAIPARLRGYVPNGLAGPAALALMVGVFFVLKNLGIALTTDRQSRLVTSSMESTFTRLHSGHLAAPFVRHLIEKSAIRIRTLQESIDTAFRVGMTAAAGIIAESLVVLGLCAVLLVEAPLPALIALVLLAAVLAGFSLATGRAAIRWGRQAEEAGQDVLAGLREEFDGMREIKMFRGEAYFQSLVGARYRRWLDAQRRRLTLLSLPRVIIETAFVGGALLLFVLLGGRGEGGRALPLLGLFAYAGFRMIPSANRILYLAGELRHSHAAIARMAEDDRSRCRAPDVHSERGRETPLSGPVEAIEFRAVTFRYPGQARDAVSSASFRIVRGEAVGITGETGSGKSTIADLLAGLLDPQEGRVLADGNDVREDRTGWFRRIGYVPQSPHLVDDTLLTNVAFGVDPRDVDRSRIESCLRMVRLGDVIANLPQGLETLLGERGNRLSGGEKQRVAIARALYGDPEVLLLDEASSALDARTEAEIRSEILGMAGARTVILIAHRISLLNDCPRLLVVRGGRIVADGAPERIENEYPRAFSRP